MSVHQPTNSAEFKKIQSENADKYIIVDFTATWCGPCKQIAPVFAEMAKEFPDIVFVKVDVDQLEDVAQANDIQCMPTFKLFKGEKYEGVSVSGANEAKIREILQGASK